MRIRMNAALRISSLFLFFLLLHNNAAGRHLVYDRSQVVESVKSVVSGIGRQLAHTLPRPRELWDLSKQTLIGLPERAVFGTIHRLCSLYMASDNINPAVQPDINQLYFQLRTPCQHESFPLQQADLILQSPLFDSTKKTVLFVSGWASTLESNSIAALAKAYNCRGGYNFLAFNASIFIDTLYTWSAFNTEELGRLVAIGLEKLRKVVPTSNMHLIGFSLGAHIVGSAGRYYQQLTGEIIPRITGLDPANPCFNEGENLSGLQRGDAAFVDVVHSNPGGLGKRSAIGDIDFYAGGFRNVKPGCSTFGCSHKRAWQYYAESVYQGHENAFMATRCSSLRKAKTGVCSNANMPMGHSVPFNAKGIYVVAVNKHSPFGSTPNGDDDIITSTCGLCEDNY